jgi:hypothetical protein
VSAMASVGAAAIEEGTRFEVSEPGLGRMRGAASIRRVRYFATQGKLLFRELTIDYRRGVLKLAARRAKYEADRHRQEGHELGG